MMWSDIAKYLSGDDIKRISTLSGRALDGGNGKRIRHADRWTKVAKMVATVHPRLSE